MKNLDIRNYAKQKNIMLWQISEELGYSHETAFSRLLRHELQDDTKQQIYKIIDDLSQREGV